MLVHLIPTMRIPAEGGTIGRTLRRTFRSAPAARLPSASVAMGGRYSHPLEVPPKLPNYPAALVPDEQVMRTVMDTMCPNGGQPFLCAEGRIWFLCQSRISVYAANSAFPSCPSAQKNACAFSNLVHAAFGALGRWGSSEFTQSFQVLTEAGQTPILTNAVFIQKHARIVFVVPPLFNYSTNMHEGEWCAQSRVYLLDPFSADEPVRFSVR